MGGSMSSALSSAKVTPDRTMHLKNDLTYYKTMRLENEERKCRELYSAILRHYSYERVALWNSKGGNFYERRSCRRVPGGGRIWSAQCL